MSIAPFFMYSGDAFPTPDALLACRSLKRLKPLEEPMAQFYAEIELYRQLSSHPARVRDPALAELFYVPILPHLDADAGGCNGTSHRLRMSHIAATLRASPYWQRSNGTNHMWACTCVMMKAMVTNELWSLLRTAVHAVHSVPRGHASPSRCQIAIPYSNPTFASVSAAAQDWRIPGRPRPILAHFRGRIMNRVRSVLVKRYGPQPGHVIEAAHPATAARCNLNKCSAKAKAAHAFPSQQAHLDEMTRSVFCLVPAGDSPPSSRLYLAVAAGCIPVLISDAFEGAFSSTVPWSTFSLRFPERDVTSGAANLTALLRTVAHDPLRLGGLQRALQEHAHDVLWEAPRSKVGEHALALATHARRKVCQPTALTNAESFVAKAGVASKPGPQVSWAAPE